MTANDPTGALSSEWSYGFPNGEPEEGPPHTLPQRIPGATLGVDAVAEGIVQRADRQDGGNR